MNSNQTLRIAHDGMKSFLGPEFEGGVASVRLTLG